VDFDSVAETIVEKCMRVQPNETILVSGGLYCWELIEDIAVSITKQNAYYIITPHTDSLQKRVLTEADISFLETLPTPMAELAAFIDGRIVIDPLEDPRSLQDVPESRIGARRQAFRSIYDVLLERKVRWTGMGFPTPEKAEMYGIDYEAFFDMFWKAVTTDYEKMYEKGKKIADILRGAREVCITTDKTDLKFSLVGRPVLIDDGIISEEDVTIGDFGNNLPAGEVFCAPIEVSAEGRAVFDLAFYKGERITGIDVVFDKGKVVSVSCEENETVFKEVLANAHGAKDVIGEFGIGLNPEVTRAVGYVITDEKLIGSIHIALGENRGFGGENESSLHWDLVMMRPTVEVDGILVMEEGTFKV
jgi:aminopeptidase